jgi:hypothetical protein
MRHHLRVQRVRYRHNFRLLSRYFVVTLYDNPVGVFVAGFIGSPTMNFIRARLDRENGGCATTSATHASS